MTSELREKNAGVYSIFALKTGIFSDIYVLLLYLHDSPAILLFLRIQKFLNVTEIF